MLKQLQQSLAATNRPTQVFETGDGTRLLLLPYGARVLGLFTKKGDENFYWTNPSLDEPGAATRMFADPDWHNTGGDRTWVAPELDIFYPNYPDLSRHVPPAQLDATGFEVLAKHNAAGFRRKVTLYVARAHREFEFELTKWFEPALNPLRREPQHADVVSTVQYAGYTQRVTLTQTGQNAQQRVVVGIWNLIQMPHGGEMIIPTYAKTEPLAMIGTIPAANLTCEDRVIRYRMDYPGEHKIAVRAAFTTGRAGYLRRTGNQWSLVIRNFFVDPSGEYVDVPTENVNDLGYSFQAMNILSSLGAFCELEHHSPAMGQSADQHSITDVSQVWAYSGPPEAIKAVSRLLLGVDP
jgi:hypothetical protein